MTRAGGRFRLVVLSDFRSRRPDIEWDLRQHRKLRPLGVRLLQRLTQSPNSIAFGEYHSDQGNIQLHVTPLYSM